MPRAPDGTYSLPSGTLVNTGDTLLVSQHNPPMTDIAQAISASLDRDGLGGMRGDLDMGGFRGVNMAPGVSPTDAATVSQLAASSSIQVGTVVDFAGSTAPTGWLLCGGQSLNRADYPSLFAVIGTTYGSLTGATFSLPDCRGRVSAGRDFDQGGTAGRLTAMSPNGTSLGATGGAQSVALSTNQLPAHNHTGTAASAGAHTHTTENSGSDNASGVGTIVGSNVAGVTGSAGTHTHTLTIDNTGSGDGHPNVQPTILFNKIIKAL